MLKKIYQELMAIRKELQAIRGDLEHIRKHPFNLVTGFVRSPNYDTGEPKQGELMEWRRFELLTESEAERERLERILEERNLSRQDLAIILFGLRVRPEFGKEHFGI